MVKAEGTPAKSDEDASLEESVRSDPPVPFSKCVRPVLGVPMEQVEREGPRARPSARAPGRLRWDRSRLPRAPAPAGGTRRPSRSSGGARTRPAKFANFRGADTRPTLRRRPSSWSASGAAGPSGRRARRALERRNTSPSRGETMPSSDTTARKGWTALLLYLGRNSSESSSKRLLSFY